MLPEAPMVGTPLARFETRKPPTPAKLNSRKARPGPYTSATAGPRFRIHIMLNTMWSRPPCRYIAVSSVHHQPRSMAKPPVMPSCARARLPGDSSENRPAGRSSASGCSRHASAYSVTQAVTMAENRSRRPPSARRRTVAHPNSPGRHAPQNGHCCSLTPTNRPHWGQTTEP